MGFKRKEYFIPYSKGNLLKIIQEQGIFINVLCGGKGLCGKCKVLIKEGKTNPLTEIEKKLLLEEELQKGIRLACQVELESDLRIEILDKINGIKISTFFDKPFKISINSLISLKEFALPFPSLYDQRSDIERIREEYHLRIEKIDLIRKIPEFLRKNNFRGKFILYDDEIIDIREESFDKPLGIAFDIGTTTIVGYLLDLSSGKELGIESQLNPQIQFGGDVISRINYIINEEKGLQVLRNLLLKALKDITKKLCKSNRVSPLDIYGVSIVGNPTMTHIFLGISPKYITFSPYIPVVTSKLELNAKEIEFDISPFAKVYVFPQVSGYVGGDIIAGILATNLLEEEKNILFIDMGTNGELVLKTSSGIFSCATAAGPAFEGGNISYGMIASLGAVDHVWIENGKINFSVIGNVEEKGICGSGLIDAISVMLDLGIINKRGNILEGKEFSLGKIKISQKDIRELQLAKSAIRAGIEILLKEAGITFEDLDKVYLAGSFGNYLRKESILKIKLLPPLSLDKISLIGNSAGRGAEMVLLNKDFRKIIEKISKSIKYIELSQRRDFQEYFIDFMFF